MNKVGDIYDKDGVYFIVSEMTNGAMTYSMPLSRYILINYIGETKDALEEFQNTILRYENQKQINFRF